MKKTLLTEQRGSRAFLPTTAQGASGALLHAVKPALAAGPPQAAAAASGHDVECRAFLSTAARCPRPPEGPSPGEAWRTAGVAKGGTPAGTETWAGHGAGHAVQTPPTVLAF